MKNITRLLLPITLALAVVYVCAVSFFRYSKAVSAAKLYDAPVTVVIDPGHGGEDGGASSLDGVCESGINLDISLRLRDLLSLVGVRTAMIRETDTAVYTEGTTISQKKVSDLKNRVQTVNATPNALLVSIHQNFFEQQKYSGAQVFFAKTDGSRALAERTQTNLREGVEPSNHRQAKPSQSVYLMEHVNCTAILVECGFLSNREEAARLQDASYQKKLAAAVCASVQGYLNEEEDTNEV